MRRNSPSFGRLLRRAEFTAAAKGARLHREAFGLQARRRPDAPDDAPRYGITVTKKTAPHAVDRNRMRRRLREALRLGAALSGSPGHDYVIVGREPLLRLPFDALRDALAAAVADVTKRAPRRPQSAGRPKAE